MTNDDSVLPCVLWLTGLPGAGKSTLAAALNERLGRSGRPVEWLDGDRMRALISGVGFEREQRDAYLRHMAVLASTLERHGITTIASFVSPYQASRDFARSLCQRFVEIYLATPLEECERRDPKGLYRQAREGRLKNFTGLSDPYEVPLAPELTFDTTKLEVSVAVNATIEFLKQYSTIG